MATGYKDFTNNGSTLRINYSYTQNAIENKSTITITSIKFKAGSIYGWYYADGILTINGTSITYSNDETSGVNCENAGTFYTLGSTTGLPSFTISHNSSGAGHFTISVAARSGTGYSDFNIFCERSYSGNFSLPQQSVNVNLPAIDRTAPTVTLTAAAASTSSINYSVTTTAECDVWQYKLEDGDWKDLSTTVGTSISGTLTNLITKSRTLTVRARKVSNHVYGTSSSVTVDLVAPTITFSITAITVAGFTINASANVNCNLWQYKIGSGSWTTFSSTSGSSASVTLSNLSPDTSYSVQVRARKKSNSLYGTAAAQTAKTLGPSTLNSASDFAIDVATPTASFNVSVYSTFYHKLHFYKSDGTTLITSRNLGSYSACTNTAKTVSLTSANRTTLLNQIPSAKKLVVKVAIETFTDSGYTNSIGVSAQKQITLTTSASVSAPTFTAFTYADTESAVTSVTGNDQVLVKKYSHLVVTATAGAAKNGASISGYSVSIGDVSMSDTSTTLDVGAVSSTGSLTLSVTCSDSRGYSTTVTKSVTVLAYSIPRLTNYSLRRRNEIEALVQLVFGGSVSSVKVNNVEKNSVVSIKLKYKKTSASSWTTKTLTSAATISGLSYSYSNLELVELDETASYDFVLTITDAFGTLTNLEYVDILNQGTPLLAFRKRTSTLPPRVGINNANPEAPLDVVGDVAVEGGYFYRRLPACESGANYFVCRIRDKDGNWRGGLCFYPSSTYGDGLRLTALRNVNGVSYSHNLTLYINANGKRRVVVTEQEPWQVGLGTCYIAGDTVTFSTTSYTQFPGGMRGSNAFNFTIPLSKPVASGVTASVSGSVVVFVNGSYHTMSDIDTDSNISLAVKVDGSGVTVHGVWATPPSWYSAQTPCGFQAYGLTITFS